MRKRLLSAVISLCLMLVMFPASVLAAYKNPFTDVNTTDWYYSNVQYVYENGLMNGTSDTTFAPTGITNRGMVVTILYRQEGQPTVTAKNPFSDVGAGTYYEKAIIWANKNGIVNGYSKTSYAPEDPITREQMAAIVYRYADYKGYDVTAKTNLNKYQDLNQLSSWASTAMSWANAKGLINGLTETTLGPQGNAERAQVAAILQRFVENIVKAEEKPEEKPEATPIPTPVPDQAVEVRSVEDLLSAIASGETNLKSGDLIVDDGEQISIPEGVSLKVEGTLSVDADSEVVNDGGNVEIEKLSLHVGKGETPHSEFINKGTAVIEDVVLEDNSWDERFEWITFKNGEAEEDNTDVSMEITGKMDIGSCNVVSNEEGATLTVAKKAEVLIDANNAGLDNWGEMIVDGTVTVEDGEYFGLRIDDAGWFYGDSYTGWFGAWGNTVVNGKFMLGKAAWMEVTGTFKVAEGGLLQMEEGELVECGYLACDEEGNVLGDEDGHVVFESHEWDDERGGENWHEEWFSAGIGNSGTIIIDGKAVVGANSTIDNGQWSEESLPVATIRVNGDLELKGNINNMPNGEVFVSGNMEVSSGYFGNDGYLEVVTEGGNVTLENAALDNSPIGNVRVDNKLELKDAKYLGICEYVNEYGDVYGEYENASRVGNEGGFIVNGTMRIGCAGHLYNGETGELIIDGTMNANTGKREEFGYCDVAEDGKVTFAPGEWDDERGDLGWYDERSFTHIENHGLLQVNGFGTLNADGITNEVDVYEDENGIGTVSGIIDIDKDGIINLYGWFENDAESYMGEEDQYEWAAAEVTIDKGASFVLKSSEDNAANMTNCGEITVNGVLKVERFCRVCNTHKEIWDTVDGEEQCVSVKDGNLFVSGTVDMTDVHIEWVEYEEPSGDIIRVVDYIDGSELENSGYVYVDDGGKLDVYANRIYSHGAFYVAPGGEVVLTGVVVDVQRDGTPEYYTNQDIHFNGETRIEGKVVANDCDVCNWGEGAIAVNGDVEINGGRFYLGDSAGLIIEEEANVVLGKNTGSVDEGGIIIIDMEKEDGTIERHIPMDLSALGNVEYCAIVRTYEGLKAANDPSLGFTGCETEADIYISEDVTLDVSLSLGGSLEVADGCTVTLAGTLYNRNDFPIILNGSATIELVGDTTGEGADHGYIGYRRDGFEVSEDVEQSADSEYAYKVTITRAE